MFLGLVDSASIILFLQTEKRDFIANEEIYFFLNVFVSTLKIKNNKCVKGPIKIKELKPLNSSTITSGHFF